MAGIPTIHPEVWSGHLAAPDGISGAFLEEKPWVDGNFWHLEKRLLNTLFGVDKINNRTDVRDYF